MHLTRASALSAARDAVLRDRAATHGAPEDTFAAIAGLWSVYLGRPVSAADVAAMMALLKIARLKSNPAHGDNWIDLIGYGACGAELSGAALPEAGE